MTIKNKNGLTIEPHQIYSTRDGENVKVVNDLEVQSGTIRVMFEWTIGSFYPNHTILVNPNDLVKVVD